MSIFLGLQFLFLPLFVIFCTTTHIYPDRDLVSKLARAITYMGALFWRGGAASLSLSRSLSRIDGAPGIMGPCSAVTLQDYPWGGDGAYDSCRFPQEQAVSRMTLQSEARFHCSGKCVFWAGNVLFSPTLLPRRPRPLLCIQQWSWLDFFCGSISCTHGNCFYRARVCKYPPLELDTEPWGTTLFPSLVAPRGRDRLGFLGVGNPLRRDGYRFRAVFPPPLLFAQREETAVLGHYGGCKAPSPE